MTTRWMAGVARRLAPPAAGTDADLLARFAEARDPGAFAAIVARHGAAVYGVCRAKLGATADADDAFQVVFYVLARDARSIRDRESVAGWLSRVAYLTALKVRRHHARHPTAALPADAVAVPLPDDVAAREERAIVAEELAALPDKFRSVLVLCAVEGRTNVEAAEALGCPRGTVDSRLATAKAKLRARLLRRGIGLTALAGFEAVLPQLGAGGGGWPALADGSWLTAIQYGTGASPPTPLTFLADGVSTAMTTTTKLVATVLFAGGLLATTGFGLTQGSGDGPPAPAAKAAPPAKAEVPKSPAKAEANPDAPAPQRAPTVWVESEARLQLARLASEMPETLTLRELIKLLQKDYGLIVRIDLAAFQRLTSPDFKIAELYERKLMFPLTNGMTVANVLNDVVSEIGAAYRVRDGRIIIVPAYTPGSTRGLFQNAVDNPEVDQRAILELVASEPISIYLDELPFSQAIREVRRVTGANIVVTQNSNKPDTLDKLLVSATLDDVKLLTALEVIADVAAMRVVFANNVYYLTSPENAQRLQKKADEEMPRRKAHQVPTGYVTDGVSFFLKPADLKPVTPAADGSLPPVTAAKK